MMTSSRSRRGRALSLWCLFCHGPICRPHVAASIPYVNIEIYPQGPVVRIAAQPRELFDSLYDRRMSMDMFSID